MMEPGLQKEEFEMGQDHPNDRNGQPDRHPDAVTNPQGPKIENDADIERIIRQNQEQVKASGIKLDEIDDLEKPSVSQPEKRQPETIKPEPIKPEAVRFQTQSAEQIKKENDRPKAETDDEKIEREMAEMFDKEKANVTAAKRSDDKDDEKENAEIKQTAFNVSQINDPQQQIDTIVQLAMTKSPYYAVKVARHLDDNYILNEIHDRLIEDQVREELIRKGLLKNI